MSLFPKAEQRAITGESLWGGAWSDRRYQSKAGETVGFDSVVGLDAVAACLGLLSDLVYMLPVSAYRDVDGVPQKASVQPSIVASPSLTVDARVWRSQLVVSLALWGNAYGLVMSRDQYRFPRTVEWVDPIRISVEEPSTISRDLVIRLDGQPVAVDDILHVPGRYVRPGTRLGLAPLERFRETFGLALAARNFGAQWFGDGAHPSAVLASDEKLTPDVANTIKERFLAAIRGRRSVAVLGAGLEYRPIQMAPNESQFAETQDRSTVAVARAFGMPADMIDAAVSGQSVTYANREQRAIDFLTFHADPWLVRVEDLLTRNMVAPLYAKFNRGALLRTDTQTRYQAHDTAIRGGWRTPNEVRLLEDESPLPAGQGDEALWPPYATSLPPQGATP